LNKRKEKEREREREKERKREEDDEGCMWIDLLSERDMCTANLTGVDGAPCQSTQYL
jgi:hypothetical protein